MAVAGRPRDWRSPGSPDRLAPQEREFVAERDSFFMASVGARLSKLAPPRPSSVLFTPVSCCRRRTGADPVSARPRMIGPALKHDAKGCCCFRLWPHHNGDVLQAHEEGVKVSKPTNKTSTPSGPPGHDHRCSELVRNFRLPQSCPARRRSDD